jgi:LmbE family N-acetylglucosaminyl deacetylase
MSENGRDAGGDGRRVLAIGAHPDDIEFGAGGTVARWVDEGWDVRYVIVTSGQRGVQDARQDPEEFGRLREEESRAAAKVAGVNDVTFLGYMDTEVVYSRELQRDLSREFRRHRPHRLLVQNPEHLPQGGFINHPDHRAVATAALDITITGGTTAGIFPELVTDEGLQPWYELEEIWLMGPSGGDEVVDVTAYIDRKLAALEAHASQIAQVPRNLREFIERRLEATGAPRGYRYAESFRIISRRR